MRTRINNKDAARQGRWAMDGFSGAQWSERQAMKIRQATVRSGRTIPHPTRSFSNVKTEVELVADIEESENPAECINKLRIQAEQIVHTHQEQVCESIRKGVEIQSTQTRIEQLEAELAVLKGKQKIHQGLLFATTEVNEADDNWS